MQQLVRTMAIVGGGCSGAVLAANLLRKATHTPKRLLLIERERDIGCGVAYEQHALHGEYIQEVARCRAVCAALDPARTCAQR